MIKKKHFVRYTITTTVISMISQKCRMKKSYTKKNIEHPVKEIYKSVHGISPPIVKKEATREITPKETPCNLRNFRFLCLDNKKTYICNQTYYVLTPTDIFGKFTGKHLCQSFFFACNLLKKRLWHRFFCCEFCKISKNTFSYRTPPVVASVKKKIKNQNDDMLMSNLHTIFSASRFKTPPVLILE